MAWEIVFPDAEKPKSLANFLKKRFPIGYVRKLFRKNGVRLNGGRTTPDELARPGDRIQLYIPFAKHTDIHSKKVSSFPTRLEILFEDEDLLVINKRAGLSVHEGKDIPKRRSLLGILESIYQPQGVHPRLIHRLDRDTSGLILVAKHDGVATQLEHLFETGAVRKQYLSLVVGRLESKEAQIALPLPGREGKLVRALTRFEVERVFSNTTLVRVRTETGRMHQIRLHFAKVGHPVVLDNEHGDFEFNKQFRRTHGLKRQFLHASAIALKYGNKKRNWTAPLPEDLARTLQSLMNP